MTNLLIGASGFVGSMIGSQAEFAVTANSSSVASMSARTGKSFDLVVCAAPSGTKWMANAYPDADIANVLWLGDRLAEIKAERFILISTVDAITPTPGVPITEATGYGTKPLGGAYGRHRARLEQTVRQAHPHALIVRLPALYGPGLKKNLVFDLANGRPIEYTAESTFQFWDVRRTWDFARYHLECGRTVMHPWPEPTTVAEVAGLFGVTEFGSKVANYDVRSEVAPMLHKTQILRDIRHYHVLGHQV